MSDRDQSATAAPGWYPDPDVLGGQRYWDGSRWTDQTVPPAPAGPPPGWYPDPYGGTDQRYWDGGQWTDHTFEPPLLDVHLRHMMTGKRYHVVLTTDRLTRNDDSIEFAAVEHVLYNTGVATAGALRGRLRSYDFKLEGSGTKLDLYFGGLPKDPDAELCARTYQALVETSKAHIEPRLCALIIDRLDAGETVNVAGFDTSSHGLRNGKKTVTWSDYEDLLIDRLAVPRVQARRPDGQIDEELHGSARIAHDKVLARELFAMCASHFS
jgi:hypothetical protein